MKRRVGTSITRQKAEDFDLMFPLLDSVHEDIKELTKRKQDGVLSKARVAMINRLLAAAKDILANERSVAFLDLLSEEDIPQNADALMMVGQFMAALRTFREKCRDEDDDYNFIWKIKE